MVSFTTVLYALSALSAVTALPAVTKATCPKGLYIIVARGSTEPQGEGVTGGVADAIAKQIPGTKSVGLVYPALISEYVDSVSNGTRSLTAAIKSFTKSCPNTKYAILGYSQGGPVTMDTLCGCSEEIFPQTSPIDTKYTKNLVAAVTFGDPTFIHGQSYDAGTSKTDGIFPRRKLTPCKQYAKKVVEYCDKGDIYCASGNDRSVHGGYFAKYTTKVATFVVNKYHGK